ncbi:MAG: hypothetical protein KAF41_06325 [Flavobacterium sp.]|nr:hypothetical protein [Flavobacterium sp.]
MKPLKDGIESLYDVFSQYTASGMEYCDCGCIDPEDVKRLYSKPLRQLEEADLAAYHGSALFTIGELEHYKHFLPRYFEIYATKRKSALNDLYDISAKLLYANWQDWPINEVQAIRDFVLADWCEFVNKSESDISTSDLEDYLHFFGIEQLIQLWDVVHSENGLKNFVLFFFYYGNQILDLKLILNQENAAAALRSMIDVENLINLLEEEYFKNEENDKAYAEKVSVVLQMIEQQLKIDQIR